MNDLSIEDIKGLSPDSLFISDVKTGILITRFQDISPTAKNNIIITYTENLDEFNFQSVLNNQEELFEDYYEGDGAMLGYPFGPTPSYEPYYVPLADMPEEVRMLYRYDPEGAKELLTEAGYPEGFKAVITCTAAQADYLSIIKEYLAGVNIEMELLVVEASAFNGLRNNREYEMIYMTAGIWAPFEMLNTKQSQGMCVRNTPDAYYDEVQECIASNIVSNPNKYIQCVKDAAVYELKSAWGIWSPRPNQYNAWWPWVRDYNGIFWTGWAGVWDWTKSIWLDKDLKASMGY